MSVQPNIKSTQNPYLRFQLKKIIQIRGTIKHFPSDYDGYNVGGSDQTVIRTSLLENLPGHTLLYITLVSVENKGLRNLNCFPLSIALINPATALKRVKLSQYM